MPFHIVKYKTGWRVKDDNGNTYSNKPLTKKRARQQQKALYASESRKEFITGRGYAGYTDDEGNYHILMSGEGWFGDVWTKIKSVGRKVIGSVATAPLQIASDVLTTQQRQDYPPKVRDVLRQYGSGQVYDLLIMREPVQSYIDKALNVITLGKWNEAKRELNYDRLFHLSMIAFLSMPNGSKAQLKIEKNEVINITPNIKSHVGESIHVPVPCCITLGEMMKKAEEATGPGFFTYEAFNNNCQIFLLSILKANGLATRDIDSFIKQNAEELLKRLPSYTRPFAKAITGLAGVANRLMYGEGNMYMEAKGITGGRIYCGLKEKALPAGDRVGNRWECFKKGIGVGMMLESQKEPALEEMTLRQLGQEASKRGVKGYSRMNKQTLIDVLRPLRGGSLNTDGSWTGDFQQWKKAGSPGCGVNYVYNPDGTCFENCVETEQPFSCVVHDVGNAKREELNTYKDKAQIRTALQDGDNVRRALSLNQLKQDEEAAKRLTSTADVPPVPSWDSIRSVSSWDEIPKDYTGFAKMGTPKMNNIVYYRNGTVIRTGLTPGSQALNVDWNTVKQRWDKLQSSDRTRPGDFSTTRKDGSTTSYDSQGREIFDVAYHGSVKYLNSVEGRHIREADPYFEELYQRMLDNETRNLTDAQAQKKMKELEATFKKEENERYGKNQDIYSPEANFTLTDKNGRQQRVNKVRLRQDGGYDIQFANGSWEYQPGKDEWDCNEWTQGDDFRDYAVCGSEQRKKVAERKANEIRTQRDKQWDGMSGWEKFLNGVNVAGAITQDYVLPVASTIASLVPGGQAISTGLDLAGELTSALNQGQCRHYNECTDEMVENAKAQSLYHRTRGDTVAQQYLEDENWQKLLEGNTNVYGLLNDNINYGSRAGKFYATGEGKYVNSQPRITEPFRRQLKREGMTPEKYLGVVREIADEKGYDKRAIEFSDDPEKKLMIYDDDGNKVHFGAVGYGDFILWSKQEALGKVRNGYAEMKRRVFIKSHSKIKGDWKSDKFSPNSLALSILWDS